MSKSKVDVEISLEDQEIVQIFAKRLAELQQAIEKRKLSDAILPKSRTIIRLEK